MGLPGHLAALSDMPMLLILCSYFGFVCTHEAKYIISMNKSPLFSVFMLNICLLVGVNVV